MSQKMSLREWWNGKPHDPGESNDPWVRHQNMIYPGPYNPTLACARRGIVGLNLIGGAALAFVIVSGHAFGSDPPQHNVLENHSTP